MWVFRNHSDVIEIVGIVDFITVDHTIFNDPLAAFEGRF